MGSLTNRGRQGLAACTLQPSRFPLQSAITHLQSLARGVR
jgi:hypothetical protein